MRSATRAALVVALTVAAGAIADDRSLRETTLREAALDRGLQSPDELVPEIDPALAAVGETLFSSTLLSLNGDTSCESCHLDQFGSADGLPVAVGVGGVGEGAERLASGGSIVPRNTLPFWGRGGVGFETFFWDGKVQRREDGVVSQFGPDAPSDDPLVVAAHLPPVEIREMLVDDAYVRESLLTETVASADEIYGQLAARLRADPVIGPALADAAGVPVEEVEYVHIAEALAAFIRQKFQMRSSRFSRFVFASGELDEPELRGGLLFYGKGRCAACHFGPYLTDFEFHAMPLPQAGFGKNGFGVDYGRYNATLDPDDLYLFRTPPLWQVALTAPYGHAGGAATIPEAVRYHFDPLFALDGSTMDPRDRVEFARRLALWGGSGPRIPELSEEEVAELEAFLHTLSFLD